MVLQIFYFFPYTGIYRDPHFEIQRSGLYGFFTRIIYFGAFPDRGDFFHIFKYFINKAVPFLLRQKAGLNGYKDL